MDHKTLPHQLMNHKNQRNPINPRKLKSQRNPRRKRAVLEMLQRVINQPIETDDTHLLYEQADLNPPTK